MAVELLRLKLAMQRRAIGSGGLAQQIGFVARWVLALCLGIASGHVVGHRALAAEGGNGQLLVILVFSVAYLVWVLGPILLPGFADQLVDPAALELLPVTARQQVGGVLLGGLVAPTSLFTLLLAAGGTFGEGAPLQVRVLVAFSAVVFTVMCVASSRAAQALMAGVLDSRRGRDLVILVTLVLALVIYLATQNLTRLVESLADAGSSGVQDAVAWLPPGGLGQVRFDAASSAWLAVLAHLVIAAALTAAALWLWREAIRRRVEGTSGAGRARPGAPASAGALSLLPFPISAARPTSLTAATSQQLRYFFFRSPQALQTAVLAVVLAVVAGHSSANQGDAQGLVLGALGVGLLLSVMVMGNLFSYDDVGFSSMLVSGAPWRTVLVGKALAWPLVAIPVLAAFVLVESAWHSIWSAAAPALLVGVALVIASIGIGAMVSVRHPQNRIQRNGGGLTAVRSWVEFFFSLLLLCVVGGVLWGLLRDGLPEWILAVGGLSLATLVALAALGSAAARLERDPWRVEALLMGESVPAPPPMTGGPDAMGPIISYLDWSVRGRTSVGRYLAGLALIVVSWQLGAALVGMALPDPGSTGDEVGAGSLVANLAPFLPGFLLTPLIVRGVLARPWFSVALPRPQVRLGEFGLGALAAAAGLAIALLLTAPIWPATFHGFDWAVLLPAAGVAVVLVLVQAGFEELLFRGYLQQFVRRVIDAPAFIIGVSAVVFALLHIGNLQTSGGDPLVLVPYLVMGLAYGWAAWRSGSLWLPLGMHWANNVAAIVLVGLVGDVIPTVAPITRDLGEAPLWALALNSIIYFTITLLLVRWILRRRARQAASAAADPSPQHTSARA